MKIGKINLDNYSKPMVIAEIGANHNGDIELAKKMILEAKKVGADCVKFQSWTKDSIFSKVVYDENYFLKDDYRQRSDYNLEEIVDKFSFGENVFRALKEFCDENDIIFSTTPFSKKEVDFIVDELDVDFVKIASMDLNNYPFLKYIALKGKPMILSTGLSNLAEIDEAVRTIYATGNRQLIILHCVSVYPTPESDININSIDMLREVYEVPVGYSDHSIGSTASVLAVGKGACVIEKHFTLDKDMFGWDHKISADPKELEDLVKSVASAHRMLGSFNKVVVEDMERQVAFRRSIVAGRNIRKGEIFIEEMLDYKRPGSGIEPKYVNMIVGKEARRDISYDELIQTKDF